MGYAGSSGGTTNLNTSFQAYISDSNTTTSDAAQQAYYYTYSGTSPTTCNADSQYTLVSSQYHFGDGGPE